jgi:hypothetical protein
VVDLFLLNFCLLSTRSKTVPHQDGGRGVDASARCNEGTSHQPAQEPSTVVMVDVPYGLAASVCYSITWSGVVTQYYGST